MKRLPARFYQSSSGDEPVREWLKSLSPADRRIIGEDIATVEFGWPVGLPTCRPLGNGLFEIRSGLSSNRISRVIFCIQENACVLLHAFIKKTQKTPAADLALARRRQNEVQ
jgi:phage-related protein